MNLNWFPGHMVKTQKLIQQNIKLVDVVIEILDARIPISSRNPDVEKLAGGKPRVIVLNKSDLSSSEINDEWKNYFSQLDTKAVMVDSIKGKGINECIDITKQTVKQKMENEIKKGRRARPIRTMVIGIPNVGKSAFINKLSGKASAKTGNKPGVTKGKQWIRISNDFELLDMPGILWPKFEANVGLKLAFTGAIKDEVFDVVEVTMELLNFLVINYPDNLMNRYKLDNLGYNDSLELLKAIGKKRGKLSSGGEVDLHKISQIILDEFRNGKLGNISLERPEEIE